VYRGFDIGSGKPTAEELASVRQHLIDSVDPSESLDAARYAQLDDELIATLTARGVVPVVVGGTGLWLRALLRGLVELPAADAVLREQLEREFDALGASAMHERLRAVDPHSAARVHPNDKLRVVRALEVHAQTGQALGALRAQHALGSARLNALVLAIDLQEPHYRTAIEARTARMLARGWVDETRRLVSRHGAHVRPLGSVGYAQVLEHVAGNASLAETEIRIVQATRVYARRQRTWARTDPDIPSALLPDAVLGSEVMARIEAHVSG
jgi:tRNA dimethylallyltransferase